MLSSKINTVALCGTKAQINDFPNLVPGPKIKEIIFPSTDRLTTALDSY